MIVHEFHEKDAPPSRFLDTQRRFQVRPLLRIELDEGGFHWDLFDDENISVKASLLTHRVPCYGYVVEETYERKVDPLRARGWGVEPGPSFAKLEVSGKVWFGLCFLYLSRVKLEVVVRRVLRLRRSFGFLW